VTARVVPQSRLCGVAHKVLPEQLRHLERHDVIRRIERNGHDRRRVGYALTELGRTQRPVLATMADWGSRQRRGGEWPPRYGGAPWRGASHSMSNPAHRTPPSAGTRPSSVADQRRVRSGRGSPFRLLGRYTPSAAITASPRQVCEWTLQHGPLLERAAARRKGRAAQDSTGGVDW
jgi:HxlR-like helix-turn-helix